jgi:hypothetical protein
VITQEQARRLQDIAPPWQPAAGDRFVVPHTELDEVFVIADMTIEAHEVPGGRIIRFNGTTEWALDSIAADSVLWLPREDQLRTLLGSAFRRLEAIGDGFAVVLDDDTRYVDLDAERAYARAAISLLEGTTKE